MVKGRIRNAWRLPQLTAHAFGILAIFALAICALAYRSWTTRPSLTLEAEPCPVRSINNFVTAESVSTFGNRNRAILGVVAAIVVKHLCRVYS